MDLIFYFGDERERQLPQFLERLGYAVKGLGSSSPVLEAIQGQNADLIVIDGRLNTELVDLCTFFRAQELTREVPIVCIAPEHQRTLDAFEAFERVEVVPSPLSVGALASRIATQLRLRKAAGLSNERSSLAEINAALRDHNTRFQKDLEEARAIQQGLLPKELPSDPRFQIAVSYQPLEQVGGDWYFVDFPDRKHLRLHIADVSGHGLPAAFIGSMAKLAMVAAERERPDELLAVMNKYLVPQLPSGRFMTMGTCLYDPATGRVQWARAGHGPALILKRSSHQVTQLLGNGFPLGFVAETSYELIEHTLEPGDALLLYTDGVTEAQNRDMKQFGVERLSAALSAAPSKGGSGEVLRSIVDAFTRFLEGRLLKDDVTLMLLRREE
jgi:serine phosphatase RsbU (regulator of sigma subunit)